MNKMNIFEGAKFGDKFRTRRSGIAIYHGFNKGYHWLILDNITVGCGGSYYYKDDGRFCDDGTYDDKDIVAKVSDDIEQYANDEADLYGMCFLDIDERVAHHRENGFYDGFVACYNYLKNC